MRAREERDSVSPSAATCTKRGREDLAGDAYRGLEYDPLGCVNCSSSLHSGLPAETRDRPLPLTQFKDESVCSPKCIDNWEVVRYRAIDF